MKSMFQLMVEFEKALILLYLDPKRYFRSLSPRRTSSVPGKALTHTSSGHLLLGIILVKAEKLNCAWLSAAHRSVVCRNHLVKTTQSEV